MATSCARAACSTAAGLAHEGICQLELLAGEGASESESGELGMWIGEEREVGEGEGEGEGGSRGRAFALVWPDTLKLLLGGFTPRSAGIGGEDALDEASR